MAIFIGVIFCFPSAWRNWRPAFSAHAIFLGISVGVFWVLVFQLSPHDPVLLKDANRALASVPPWAAWGWVVTRVFGSILIAPIIEEVAFRGYLMRRVQSAAFDQVEYAKVGIAGWVVSAVVFGMAHEMWWAAALSGFVFSYLAARNNSLREAIAGHACANALISIVAIYTGQWHMWS